MTTDIDAIRRLLSADLGRVRRADDGLQDARYELATHPDIPAADRNLLRQAIISYEAAGTTARQEFAACTEMLQHIDLGDLTADELVASAARALGGGPAAPEADPTPTISAERTMDQDVRHFLNAHNHR